MAAELKRYVVADDDTGAVLEVAKHDYGVSFAFTSPDPEIVLDQEHVVELVGVLLEMAE